MHESIASALYRGYTRKLEARDQEFAARLEGTPPAKRNAWIRLIRSFEERDPRLVLLQPPEIIGKGKNATLYCFGAYFSLDQATGRKAWVGYLSRAKARDFTYEAETLPVIATNHLVERTMQRLNQADAKKALCALRGAFTAAVCLGPPSEYPGQIILPSDGGGVIAAQDNVDPTVWAMKTFIDYGRLSESQMLEIKKYSLLACQRFATLMGYDKSNA